jgi:5-methylcytosine-specific restriction enzyme subunit McrC
MEIKRKVPIENIFYMLSYVWGKSELIIDSYLDNNDDFESPDILAAIFLKNINSYLRTGLYREYITINEEIKGIKGKLDFKNSINNLSFENAKAFCEYDEFQENNLINKIIKTTAYKLYNLDEINSDLKGNINNTLLRFNNVDIININENIFKINFNRNNYYTYEIIKICELINSMTMISEKTGKYKFYDCFDNDEKMAKLFELFVFNFYKQKQKEIRLKASFQSQIPWDVNGLEKQWLPRMELDILLENEEEVIILDTKYYKNFYNEDSRYDQNNKKLISPNLYQIFAYINNYETSKKLGGILLYPRSYTGETADFRYQLNRIAVDKIEISEMRVKSIDLNQNWKIIETDLINLLKK